MKARYLTPAVTIFDNNGKIDEHGNVRLYEHLIKGGIDGIVVMGSTGEFFNMKIEEIKRLIDISVQHCKGKTKIYIGCSRMIAEETIELGNYAISQGADGVMVISPYYFRLTDEDIERYYDIVANGIKGKIYLYNYPDITGHDLKPQTILNLIKKHDNIVGCKDTISLISHTRDIMNIVLPLYPNFEVYSGFDENFASVALGGGAGVIGGLSNLVPELFASFVKAVEEKNFDAMAKCQKKVNTAMKIYAIGSPYIPVMKRALNLRGLNLNEYVTPPFTAPNAKQEELLIEVMKELGVYEK